MYERPIVVFISSEAESAKHSIISSSQNIVGPQCNPRMLQCCLEVLSKAVSYMWLGAIVKHTTSQD